MTATAWLFLAAASALAAIGWIASWRRWRPIVVIGRPAAMACLAGTGLWLLDVDRAPQAFFVAGVLVGGVGDLLLALPRHYFATGSVFFMIARLLYGAGFVSSGVDAGATALVLIVAVFIMLTVGRILLGQVRRLRPRLFLGTGGYMLVTALVVALGVGSGNPTAGLGVVLLALADVLLGWNRFVRALAGGHGSIHVVAHFAQAVIVLSLLSA